MSFCSGLFRLDCLATLSVVRPCYTPLETRCPRDKSSCPSLGFSIRKGRASPILASSKPPSNADGDETNGDGPASELPTVDAQPQASDSEMRTTDRRWQGLKVRLPIVGSWFGSGNVTPSKAEDTDIKWSGILDPSPDNLLALLLTGLLGLAALQIFWQLFLVAITITLAALKYSVIAAILLALLIVFL